MKIVQNDKFLSYLKLKLTTQINFCYSGCVDSCLTIQTASEKTDEGQKDYLR